MKSRRANRLLMRQAEIAAERANLSRYLPPSMVDELAHRSEPMGGVRAQEVAVLFADIVGFTRFAESHRPDEVIALLRDFHLVDEPFRDWAVVRLTPGQQDGDQAPLSICECVDLRVAHSARAANSLLPLFRPMPSGGF